MNSRVLAILFVLAIAAAAQNMTPAANSASEVPVLLELFTSEGCSSCPPADHFVQELDARQPVPGVRLIVLSEHVDYWDQQGWKDPYSSHSATQRQIDYARRFGLESPYTPQIIVDGDQVLKLADPQQVMSSFHTASISTKLPIRVHSLAPDNGARESLRVHVETGAAAGNMPIEIFVATALDRAESQVLRGENKGRHLEHVAVVQTLTKVGKVEKGKSFSQDVLIKLPKGVDTKNLRVIAFAQERGLGKVLGADSQKIGE